MRAVEISAVGLFFSLLAFSLGKTELEYTPIAAVLGWMLADLFSGLVHWALDTCGSVRTPVIGPAFIRPFREHHADPQGMTRHDFIEANGASCLGCLPILLVLAFFPRNSFLVRKLQATGLVLRPAEHAKHHTPPYDSHFCTANGWLNRPLNALLR